jgi:hypothetical protein
MQVQMSSGVEQSVQSIANASVQLQSSQPPQQLDVTPATFEVAQVQKSPNESSRQDLQQVQTNTDAAMLKDTNAQTPSPSTLMQLY